MADRLDALFVASARAGAVSADERAALATAWRELPGVLLETCHRVEVYAIADETTAQPLAARVDGIRRLRGADAARHAIDVAVGLDSVVLAEDQVLSQVRLAVAAARGRHSIDVRIGHLMDVALRSGRRARSWLPAQRPTLADLAIDHAGVELAGRRVLVVGAGRMGELAARAALRRGAAVSLTSRTASHAASAAARLGVAIAPLDPGPRMDDLAVVMVALSGTWDIGEETQSALSRSGAQVIDLSAPPALGARLRHDLDARYHAIDDLAAGDGTEIAGIETGGALLVRLRALSDAAVREFVAWARDLGPRDTARAVMEQSERVRAAELDALWRRLPGLPEEQREQIEHMTQRLTQGILQEPLIRLRTEPDEQRLDVARELFGL